MIVTAMFMPSLKTGVASLDEAFRIAVGDLCGNIVPWQGEMQDEPRPCILAGLDYDRPWTRDAAINTWYAAGLLAPEAARNTLMSSLTSDEHGLRIGGQYWDAIIWAVGAWHYYLSTEDRDFLATAMDAIRRSLARSEQRELDPEDGLFRGGACFQDGISAYPDWFVQGRDVNEGILRWIQDNPKRRSRIGGGLPCKALSTNCLYYHAYVLVERMARELAVAVPDGIRGKAARLKREINDRFWDAEQGHYRYLLDAHDDRVRQEGFGHAFAILFGVADSVRGASVIESQYTTEHGIPCLWPPYERYAAPSGMAFGRHSGTVWPQVNAAWAAAAAMIGRSDVAHREMRLLAEKACRDTQFQEIYHPLTGQPYGGRQECGGDRIAECEPCRRQTWCAAGFIHMVLTGVFGMRFAPEGINFAPALPDGAVRAELTGIRYRGGRLDVVLETSDVETPVMAVNGEKQDAIRLAAASDRDVRIELRLPPGWGVTSETN